MPATSPSHAILGGTTPYITNKIEYVSVPTPNKNCENTNLKFNVWKIVRPKSLNDFFSSPLDSEYYIAILMSPQEVFSL